MSEEKKFKIIENKARAATEKRSSESGGEAASGGLSNTHPTTTFNKGRNVFVDYLKVRFYGKFDASNSTDLTLLDPLFKILRINPLYYDEKKVKEWNNFYEYDDGTVIHSSSEFNETKNGESHYLELKGEGCRAFEKRGGNWQELIAYCVKYSNHVNRLDLSLDDIGGTIKMSQLLDRVYKGYFSTNMRRFYTRHGTSTLHYGAEVERSNNDGCTITFGSSASKELCIYNKAAERSQKRHIVNHNDWIRYEARFFKETGMKVLKELDEAFTNNTVNELIPGLIRGLVDFKVISKDIKNKYRLPTWPLWSELLDNTESIKVTNQADLETTLAKKMVWLPKASGRILSKAVLTLDNEDFEEYIKYSIASSLDKFNHKDLSQVNLLRLQLGLDTLTMDQAQNQLRKKYLAFQIPNEILAEVIGAVNYKDDENVINRFTGEIE